MTTVTNGQNMETYLIKDNNNNNINTTVNDIRINIVVIVVVVEMPMFMLLSLRHSHFENPPGLFHQCRIRTNRPSPSDQSFLMFAMKPPP